MKKLLWLLLLVGTTAQADERAVERVKAAIDYWRGETSYTEATMTIHREDWERTSSMKAWTKGSGMSLVRFTAPAKDAGNASLTIHDEVWSYAPKINRIIKIPPSMKSQSWMGSDFSYQDLAKADDIVRHYTHTIVGSESHEGKRVDVIDSVPHETAPIAWGKEVLAIREDNIMIRHDFYDQDMKLLKRLLVKEIKVIGGKLYATRMRMENAEDAGEWTEIVTTEARFGLPFDDNVFTQSNLSNPRFSGPQ